METAIANYGLVVHTLHFIPRRKYRGSVGWSWRMWRDKSPITSRGGYVLDTYCRYFYNFCTREPRVLTDHRMILAELKGGGVRINLKYCKGSTTWPIVTPKGGPMWEEDAIFDNLRK